MLRAEEEEGADWIDDDDAIAFEDDEEEVAEY